MCSSCVEPESTTSQLLSWSPDSRFVAVAASPSGETSTGITAVDVTSGKTSRLTTPPAGGARDQLPSLSPDGGTLAFVRRSGSLTGELWLQTLSGTFVPIGEPTRMGSAEVFYQGVAWSRDGHTLDRARQATQGTSGCGGSRCTIPRPSQRLSPTSDEWRQPAVSMQQSRLAFTRTTWDENLWRLTLEGAARPAGPAVSLQGLDTRGNERAVLAGRVSDCLREPALGHGGAVGGRCRRTERPAADLFRRPSWRNASVVAGRPVDCVRLANR